MPVQMARVGRTMTRREAEYIRRLRNGEENPWLVYELCKLWRSEDLDDVLHRMPSGVSLDCVLEGFHEYLDARRRGR